MPFKYPPKQLDTHLQSLGKIRKTYTPLGVTRTLTGLKVMTGRDHPTRGEIGEQRGAQRPAPCSMPTVRNEAKMEPVKTKMVPHNLEKILRL